MAGPSVLIIEDDAVIARDLRDTLHELGYRVSGIAASSDEALRMAERERPDVALTDIRIQGARDGIETADELARSHQVPVVFLSAHTDEATVARARRAAPFGYLVKPFRAMELKTSIEVALYRAAMERQIAERQRWFETTMASLDDAIVCADPEGRVKLVNRASEKLTGWSRDQALGLPLGDVVKLELPSNEVGWVPPETAALESFVRHRAGGETLVSRRDTKIVGDDGRALGSVMVLRDMSDEVRLRAQCEFLERLAALGTLAASVAHEINNPLSVILGNLDLTLSNEPMRDTTRAEMLSDVRDAAVRIRTIIGDLRGLAQPPDINTKGISAVDRAIAWAIDVTSYETRHYARLESAIEPGLFVAISHVRLGQVLVNLLRNAAQAIGPGRRGVVRVEAKGEGGRVIIRVTDTGPGMATEVQARLFEPFFTTRAKDNGTGLGLFVSRGIVHDVGGELRVESRVGEGTTFTVTLPAVGAQDAGAAPGQREAVARRRGRILLIDDDVATVTALRRVLERAHEVVTADGGTSALARLANDTRFDLVLLDLMMPDMPGDEVYTAISQRHPELEPRVVLITAGAVTRPAMELVRAMGPRVLRKPMTSDELLGAVAGFLSWGP